MRGGTTEEQGISWSRTLSAANPILDLRRVVGSETLQTKNSQSGRQGSQKARNRLGPVKEDIRDREYSKFLTCFSKARRCSLGIVPDPDSPLH